MSAKNILAFACAFLTLTSCGGPGPTSTNIQGNSLMGPVSGATITVYAMTSTGSPDPTRVLATAVTDANGNYTLSMDSTSLPNGTVVIQMSGGNYVEEGSGAAVSLSGKTFRTILPVSSNYSSVKASVGLLTNMAYQSFQHQVQAGALGGSTVAQLALNADYQVSQAFGLSDIVGTLPANTYGTIPNDSTGQYALVMAAISKQAAMLGTDSTTLVSALSQNLLTNGNLTTPSSVTVTNAAGVPVTITPPTLTALATTVSQCASGTAGLHGVTPPASFTAPSFNSTPPTTAPAGYTPGAPSTAGSTTSSGTNLTLVAAATGINATVSSTTPAALTGTPFLGSTGTGISGGALSNLGSVTLPNGLGQQVPEMILAFSLSGVNLANFSTIELKITAAGTNNIGGASGAAVYLWNNGAWVAGPTNSSTSPSGALMDQVLAVSPSQAATQGSIASPFFNTLPTNPVSIATSSQYLFVAVIGQSPASGINTVYVTGAQAILN